MKNEYSAKDRLNLFLLATGVFCFGVILPDSLSDHIKLVHFSAHFGMSFLLSLCFYMFCTVKLRISKMISYTVLIVSTLLIGTIYKYWEIATSDVFARFSFLHALEITGALTSMSQNISGILAAIMLIEGLVDRNMIMSVLKSGKLHLGPVHQIPVQKNIHPHLNLRQNTGAQDSMPGVGKPMGSQFSPEASEN